MFNKNEWKNVDLKSYSNEKFLEKKNDNTIIEEIDFEKLTSKYKLKNNKLSGVPFAIKDNYSIKNTSTTAASKIIRNLKANEDSTVVKKLVESGAVPLFKANLDELAMGGTGLTSNFGKVSNPFNEEYLVGGSSSGSNYLVADGTVPFSIGSDTGDSVRKPAAYTGIVGFKPTWGLVSRKGLYDFAPSWDSVGWFTNKVEEASILLDILQGYDNEDESSLLPRQYDFHDELKTNSKMKVVVINELSDQIVNDEIKRDYERSIDLLKEAGNEIIVANNVNVKILSSILAVYRIASSAEAFSCNSNLTGFHFGSYFENDGRSYEEQIIEARTKGFDYEVKKRFLWSQESRYSNKNEYAKALKMRRLINDEINRILSLGDVLLVPATPDLPERIDNINTYPSDYLLNNILTIFNSNGSPSITLPVTKNGYKSTSINISGLPFHDKQVLQTAHKLEELLNNE